MSKFQALKFCDCRSESSGTGKSGYNFYQRIDNLNRTPEREHHTVEGDREAEGKHTGEVQLILQFY